MVMLEKNISALCSYRSYCGQEYTQGCAWALVTNVSPSGLSLGGIQEGDSDCTPDGIRASKVKGEELDVR